MDEIERLTQQFVKFPGVGPRQARRMVFYLLRSRAGWVDELSRDMLELKRGIKICASCFRHFVPSPHDQTNQCSICNNPNRLDDSLLIVEKDVDLENIERSHVFSGKYFVLGGLYAPLKKEPEAALRLKELRQVLAARKDVLKEITIALAVNPDGEETASFLRQKLEPFAKEHEVTISMLGRGLSTGSELEYADPETIKNAFRGRS